MLKSWLLKKSIFWTKSTQGEDIEHKKCKKLNSASPRNRSETCREGLRPRRLRRGSFSFQFRTVFSYLFIFSIIIRPQHLRRGFLLQALTRQSCIHNMHTAYFRNESMIRISVKEDISGEAKQVVDLLGQEEVPQRLPRQKVLDLFSSTFSVKFIWRKKLSSTFFIVSFEKTFKIYFEKFSLIFFQCRPQQKVLN